jgi:hypothetical protein
VEKVPGMLSVTLGSVVVSVMLTPVYVAEASSSFCPFGQVMSEGGGWIVGDAVTLPFLPELNDPVALTVWGARISSCSMTWDFGPG